MIIYTILLLLLYVAVCAAAIYVLVYFLQREEIIKDYKKAVDTHNSRELRLIYITQSTKDYVKEQLNMLRSRNKFETYEDELITALNYMTFKEIEKHINQFEKDADRLIQK